jgi:uncharacterized protein (TIGR03067 family)
MSPAPWSRFVGPCGLLAALALAAPATAEDKERAEAEREAKNWSGTYRVMRLEWDGVKAEKEDLKKMKVVLKGNAGEFHAYGEVVRSRFTFSPRKSPREIDAVYLNGPLKGQAIKGIYKLEAGRLTVCYAGPGKPRPRVFATGPGSGFTLYVLQQAPKGE